MNPTVVMTAMGRLGRSDLKKAGAIMDRIPLSTKTICRWEGKRVSGKEGGGTKGSRERERVGGGRRGGEGGGSTDLLYSFWH